MTKRNYKQISDQVVSLLREYREELISKGIIQHLEPVTMEVWQLLWNKFIAHT
ncbi:hypothetical protein LCGC14_2611220, partial [marine sediment metagenome]